MSSVHRSHRFWPAFLLGIATALFALVAWHTMSPQPALAQVPDSGAQRNEMIAQQKLTNEKLAEITGLLREIRDRSPVPEKVRPSGGK
jgi:hypothetical protein